MFHTDRVIIVEGKYDKIRLSAVTDALILTTDGFGIFSDKELQRFLKTLAQTRGLLILTDSDAAGFRIRHFVTDIVKNADVLQAYIPDVYGKEGRKAQPGKEGKLGVEAMDAAVLEDALRRSGVFSESGAAPAAPVTTADLYRLGLSGKENSAEKRRRLLKELGLPQRLCGATFLKALNAFLTKEALEKAVKRLEET
ncbi:MAG: DUF4093 domain-containing protein [Clostridia bacterium]|nr:DUF4093 domain-containing protein [Clostridia bacterium]